MIFDGLFFTVILTLALSVWPYEFDAVVHAMYVSAFVGVHFFEPVKYSSKATVFPALSITLYAYRVASLAEGVKVMVVPTAHNVLLGFNETLEGGVEPFILMTV